MHSTHKTVIVLATLAALIVVARPSLAQTYTFTTLADPAGASGITQAYGLNDSSQVVGNYYDATGGHGFFYTPGIGFTTLDAPGATGNTYAKGINNAGQVVGYYDFNPSHSFLYLPGTGFTEFDEPAATTYTYANGINNTGQIAGWYYGNAGGSSFLDTPGTGFVAIDEPVAPPSSIFITGINDTGQVVGHYADNTGIHGFVGTLGNGGTLSSFTRLNDPLATLGNPAGGNHLGTYAEGINNAGQIVGYYTDHNNYHGFVYTPETGFTTLDAPAGPNYTYATDINNAGQVVGYYEDNDGSGTHIFLATPVPEADTAISLGGLLLMGAGSIVGAVRKGRKPAA